MPGSVVKVFTDDRHEAPLGTPGRIFVGNVLAFEGYTGGGTKESIQDLMAAGDVGHFDPTGRLFIDRRDDEMIESVGPLQDSARCRVRRDAAPQRGRHGAQTRAAKPINPRPGRSVTCRADHGLCRFDSAATLA